MIEIEALLKQTIGLEASTISAVTVERAVRERMAQAGVATPEEYRALLRTSAAEWNDLVESLVVPESWFFRDGAPFATLARWAMETWLPAHPHATLRLLTIPCSTGEEPYSVAMALLDAGLPAERFSVDAIDLSRRAVTRAERAIYGQNSFRGKTLGFRDRYFEFTPAGHRLAESIRRQVRFDVGNLLAPDFLPPAPRYDVIFCRNVLIYFDRPTQLRAVKILRALLTSDGLFFVGHAETGIPVESGFVPTNDAMSFAFRKASPATVATPRKPLKTPNRVLPPALPVSKVPQPAVAKKALLAEPMPVAKFTDPAVSLEAARDLADQGRLEDASRLCEAHLREHGPSAAAWYLLGLARDAAGEQTRARECYSKALYLEPGHSEALLHLALLAEQSGDAAAATQFRRRIRRTQQRSVA